MFFSITGESPEQVTIVGEIFDGERRVSGYQVSVLRKDGCFDPLLVSAGERSMSLMAEMNGIKIEDTYYSQQYVSRLWRRA